MHGSLYNPPMPPLEQVRELPLWTLGPLGAALLLIAWRSRSLSAALHRAPSRAIGLGAMDLLVGLGLLLVGGSFGAMMLASVPVQTTPLTRYMPARIAAQLLGAGLPAAYLGVRAAMRHGGLRRIGYLPARPGRDVAIGGAGALVVLAVVPGVLVLGAAAGILLGDPPPQVAHELLQSLQADRSAAGAVMLIVSAVVLAPLLEEAVYRGLFQSLMVEALGEARRWAAIVLAAGLFTLVHVGGVDWQALPALGVLGVVLGYLYERTGSLLPPVLVHAAFNAFNIAYLLLFVDGPAV